MEVNSQGCWFALLPDQVLKKVARLPFPRFRFQCATLRFQYRALKVHRGTQKWRATDKVLGTPQISTSFVMTNACALVGLANAISLRILIKKTP